MTAASYLILNGKVESGLDAISGFPAKTMTSESANLGTKFPKIAKVLALLHLVACAISILCTPQRITDTLCGMHNGLRFENKLDDRRVCFFWLLESASV